MGNEEWERRGREPGTARTAVMGNGKWVMGTAHPAHFPHCPFPLPDSLQLVDPPPAPVYIFPFVPRESGGMVDALVLGTSGIAVGVRIPPFALTAGFGIRDSGFRIRDSGFRIKIQTVETGSDLLDSCGNSGLKNVISHGRLNI